MCQVLGDKCPTHTVCFVLLRRQWADTQRWFNDHFNLANLTGMHRKYTWSPVHALKIELSEIQKLWHEISWDNIKIRQPKHTPTNTHKHTHTYIHTHTQRQKEDMCFWTIFSVNACVSCWMTLNPLDCLLFNEYNQQHIILLFCVDVVPLCALNKHCPN